MAVHVVAAGGTLGADLALVVLGAYGALGAQAGDVYPAMSRLAIAAVLPLGLLALGTGAALVARDRTRLLRLGWVRAKALITLTLVVIVTVVAIPALRDAAAQPAIADRDRLIFTIVPASTASLLLLNVLLGVLRPQRRVSNTEPRRRAPSSTAHS